METNITNMSPGDIIIMAVVMTVVLFVFLGLVTFAARRPYNELPQPPQRWEPPSGGTTVTGDAEEVTGRAGQPARRSAAATQRSSGS